MSLKQLKKLIQKGREGKNIGVSTGIPKLDSVLFGVQKGYIYTIGASSGVGKTSFTLHTFVYNLYQNALTPISFLLYSFEMSKEVLLAKILSLHIYEEFGEVVTYEDILSLSKPLSDAKLKFVEQSMDWLDGLNQCLTIFDKPIPPKGIYATSKEWLKQFGEFEAVDEYKENYLDMDSERQKVILIDHVGLIGGPGSKKEKIDEVADYMIYFRNKCNITGIFVQQLNRGVSSVDRKTQGFELVGLEDFKDSSGTTDASEVVIALYSPYREKIARCEGYPIQHVLKSRFVLIEVIKNRYGIAGVNIGTVFHGEINRFRELPKPEEIGDYSVYLDLKQQKIKKADEKETKLDDDNLFTF